MEDFSLWTRFQSSASWNPPPANSLSQIRQPNSIEMDHGHMDHGMPGMDHGGMDMDQPMCNMNMLFTWDTTNLCIIFHWWRITNILTLLISLFAVALLTAGYEAVREAARRYELRCQEYANKLPSKSPTLAFAGLEISCLARTAKPRDGENGWLKPFQS